MEESLRLPCCCVSDGREGQFLASGTSFVVGLKASSFAPTLARGRAAAGAALAQGVPPTCPCSCSQPCQAELSCSGEQQQCFKSRAHVASKQWGSWLLVSGQVKSSSMHLHRYSSAFPHIRTNMHTTPGFDPHRAHGAYSLVGSTRIYLPTCLPTYPLCYPSDVCQNPVISGGGHRSKINRSAQISR